MISRKYNNDYRLTEAVTKTGRIRMDAVYVGAWFDYTDRAAAARARLVLGVCALAGWAMFVGALFPMSGASRLFYVVLPFVFAALPLWTVTETAFLALTKKPPMIHSDADRLLTRMPKACLPGMILCGVPLLGELGTLLFAPEKLNRGDIVFCALCAGLFAVFALALLQRRGLDLQETAPEAD